IGRVHRGLSGAGMAHPAAKRDCKTVGIDMGGSINGCRLRIQWRRHMADDETTRRGGSIPVSGRKREEPDIAALPEAFPGRTRGEVDVVFAIASATGVKYEDAVNEYKRAFVAAIAAAMERIAKARERR